MFSSEVRVIEYYSISLSKMELFYSWNVLKLLIKKGVFICQIFNAIIAS